MVRIPHLIILKSYAAVQRQQMQVLVRELNLGLWGGERPATQRQQMQVLERRPDLSL